MALHRRWLLILFTLLLGGGQSFAASREERAYAEALHAFNDKLYPVAEARLNQYLQTYRKSTNGPAALLLLAQSEFYLGNYPAVTNQMGDPVNLARAKTAGVADQYVYWQAEAQFAQGGLKDSAQTFVSLIEDFPNSSLALNAEVEAAAAYGKLGEWPKADGLLDNTNGLFQRAAQAGAGGGQIADGCLLQAQSKYVQQNFAEAIEILNLLNPAVLTPEQDWKRSYLVYLANLGRNNLDAALAATTNMLEIARSNHGNNWSTNLAESVAGHAGVLGQQGRAAEAIAALHENLSGIVPAEQQQQTVLKISELALVQNDLTNAESELEKFVEEFPDSAKADLARVTLGELHLRDFVAQPAATNNLLAAESILLTISTNSPQAGEADLALGWWHWLSAQIAEKLGDTNTAGEEYSESFTFFQNAAQRLPMGQDLAVARFKMGDAQFASANFYGAGTNYQAVLDNPSASPRTTNSLAGMALYQILRARLALHDLNGVDNVMGQFLGQFATDVMSDRSLLLGGQGFSDFHLPARARDIFLQFQAERPNSPLMPEVVFAISRTYEREQNWPATVTNNEAWLKAYPTNGWRAQVEFARDWAVAQTGDEARAFVLFTNYPNAFPNSTNTPLAYWWIAGHYFGQGTNFVEAERNYENIFQKFQTNELAYPAQLMAGRAALGRFSYSDAKNYFSGILFDTNCPDGLRDKARFGYCEALLGLAPSDTNNASLSEGTNVLAQMTPKAATNIVGALAWCETGEFNLQMGALDAATNAYAQALLSPAASEELRDEAEVGLGLVLEKKAEGLLPEAQRPLLLLALNYYTDVVYTTNPVADALWTKKAALQALPLMMTLKVGDANKFIDSVERWLPQLKETLEKKRAALTANN